MNVYQSYIHKSRYARYLEQYQRRETWPETVDRYIQFWKDSGTCDAPLLKDTLESAREMILSMDIMPSMRALMTAGEALQRDHVAGYNCSYVAVDHVDSFKEIFYILLCGTGVGYSVESRYTQQLPVVKIRSSAQLGAVYKIEDSKIGWVKALERAILAGYFGAHIEFDFSQIRPSGTRLKTFGGRASGPEPLKELLEYVAVVFEHAQGRKLHTIEVHDLVCKIADVVVVGGVRRAALISLSDLNDDKMRYAKSGEWWTHSPHRALANNSAVYHDGVPVSQFMDEWHALYLSGSGERGIFNRDAAKRHIARSGLRDPNYEWGTNPCSEILLRSAQFCNLTEVVVRPKDSEKKLNQKIVLASFLGTLQSTLTDFQVLRPIWRANCEAERLLGVSLTGLLDSPQDSFSAEALENFKNVAVTANKVYAGALGITPSTSVTCVKPSGTVSQLVDCASGLHSRYAKYYIRRVRADNHDPLTHFMKDAGIEHEPDVTKPTKTTVFSFPMKAPEGATVRSDMPAIQQLEFWKRVNDHWCTHKPSVTISVKPHEWLSVGDWVLRNLDSLTGVSFLPYEEHTYAQAPYEEISESEYETLASLVPANVDFDALIESDNHTTTLTDLACTAGACEL